ACVVNCWQDTVSVLDTETDEIVARVPVGTTPWNIAVRPDGAEAYVTNANEDTVSVIDLGELSVLETIHIGHIPTGVSATADTVWVSGNASATVSALRISDRKVVGNVAIGLSAQPA